ncbi:MAG TPA: 16S rRNA (guanine(527)-N(7))-methyltransferase RsmG [Vicinamibacterales bacterium]|nr:16S rRNA (guanine(527)-N(7))-methyltransferase RsmG [Vicinamibacterales bacterium]
MQTREKLASRATEAGLSLPDTAFRGLEAYFELLRKWNQRVSLTSLPVEEWADEAIDRLLLEPAAAARYFLGSRLRVVDLGSGGGSPAIPMKLVAPTISMVMVESKQKKAAFLREAVRHLSLTDTTVESARFEELLKAPEFRESADVVTLRAVRVDPGTLVAAKDFLRPDGLLFLFSSVGHAPTHPAPGLLPHAVHSLLPHLGSRVEILRRVS